MRNFILPFIIILFLLYSCDKIETPYTESVSVELSGKTVLIEKFTGHKCSGCPEASRVIENELKPMFLNSNDNSKSAIISVAIHPGLWSSEDTVSFTKIDNDYPYDFRTNSGNTIGVDMGLNGFIPVGTINRIEGSGNRTWSKDTWGEKVYNQLVDENSDPVEQTIDIIINNNFNKTTRELSLTTTIHALTGLEGNYSLCLFIMEDGIVSPQLDGIEYIEDYIHNHIYRCPINDTYGEALNTALTPDSKPIIKIYNIVFNTSNNMHWTDDWDNISNCHVVAYIYNTDTGIIEQVSEKRIYNE